MDRSKRISPWSRRTGALPVRVALVGAVATALVGGIYVTGSWAATTADGYAGLNGGTTGGTGGAVVTASTGTEIHQALCNRASSSTPIIIQVSGIINHANTSQVSGSSCNTAADKIEIKDVSNVSIIGVGSGAVFDQLGIHVRNSSNIVIQNVTVQNVKKSGSPISNGGDAIGMESTVSNVWVDHVTLIASGGEAEGYDSLFDLKADTRYVTLSYSVLRNSGRGGLIGSSDTDTGNGPVTFHHNLYSNIDSRTPLLRSATAHIYNNYYVNLNKSGINPRNGGRARVENNYFKDSQDVLGTFYTDLPGYWQANGNILDNVTWSAADSTTNPAGPSMASNASVGVGYSYLLDTAACVPSIVQSSAGAGTGLKVSDGSCSTTNPTSTTSTTSTTTSTPTATSTTTAPASGDNLSLGAGADGSSKASGTSYGNVIDGDVTTYWSPDGTTGRVSVKWSAAQTVSQVVIKEAPGSEGTLGSWTLVNNDTGATLASGSGAGTTTFGATSLQKINLVIDSASGTPRIAEFETYATGSGSTGTTSTTTTSTTTATSTTTTSTTTATSTSTSTGTLSCTASTSAWSGGFVTNVTITNSGATAVTGWTTVLDYGQAVGVSTAWSATATASGSTVTATPASWSTTVPAGGLVSFGLQGTTSGVAPNPTCSVQ